MALVGAVMAFLARWRLKRGVKLRHHPRARWLAPYDADIFLLNESQRGGRLRVAVNYNRAREQNQSSLHRAYASAARPGIA